MGGADLRATVTFLLVSSFLMQALIGIVGIAVPLYADDMGASPLMLGIIGAVGGLIYSFMPMVSGILLERFRRKTFILASTALYGLSCILYRLAENPYILIPIKALEWISIALFWPSMEVLLTETGGENIEKTLRKFNLSWGSAMIVGPMIGGSLISAFGIRTGTPFLLSSAISLLMSLLTILVVREEPRRILSKHVLPRLDANSLGGIFSAVSSTLLFSLLGGIILNLFPAYAASLGIPAYEIGLIMLVNGLFRLVAFLEAYRIKARIGEYGVFLMGSLTLALASALTAISSTTPAFSISLSIMGFGAGILYAVSIAMLLKRLDSARGYAAGLFESLLGTGYFLGSLSGGFVANYAPNAPYILGLSISLLVTLLNSIKYMRSQPTIK